MCKLGYFANSLEKIILGVVQELGGHIAREKISNLLSVELAILSPKLVEEVIPADAGATSKSESLVV